ncbi:MAG: Protein translocase subunit SecA [Candidatus Magasanikbacteria bacterium GW2011_GWA2_45_39]|uniref:Protein translocase subunit SecA n=2 Tax=Candidatus Magasanikiibacteriota TaxID=1752731 RepID=A0A0G1MEX0_9BACT|nr:MAG: Protein translocase subunit SecA [Candidatus Magasanikbacteria bacterium GW2011_GWA2_45_39]HBW74325.1 preprotein translocase subunit SecA [Candidatus Magasanikbacteria bacterium]
MSFFKKLFGDPNARVVKELHPLVIAINKLEPQVSALSNEDLKNQTVHLKERLQKGASLDDILPEAFATVREASRRVLGMRHFDVQLMGGVVLHKGNIAEMRTGEGKTLVATLPIYLNALTGKGVHLVTVNDYLAKRDAVWMGQVYHALGLSVGIIQQQMTSFRYEPGFMEEQSAQMQTNEGASDEASQMSLVKVEPSHVRPVQRKEAYECDIVYGTNNEFGFDYLRDNMVSSFEQMSQRPLHYAIIDEVDSILIDEARTPLIISAPAEEATDQYYKFAELVRILNENEDYNIDEKLRAATLTDAGIAKLEKALGVENIYEEGGLRTVHHVEQALKAHTLFKLDRDYVVRGDEVVIVDEFTGRLMFGRRYSEGLHQAIEAKEGVKIQRESQTLATITFQNYFRLYEKLAGMTGTAATEAEEFSKIYNLEVVQVPTHRQNARVDLPDRIYKNEDGKFQAIVHEIKERHERGQPLLIGTISIEKNEALSLYLEKEGIPHEILNAKNHEREAEIIAQAGRAGAVTLATNMAGRGVDIILGGNIESDLSRLKLELSAEEFEARKGVLMAEWKKEQEKVLGAGGLLVIGTERHESRRIDNQLRGRAGRQGDPGSSQFYVSLEDDLMRIFGSERIKGMMEFLKMPADVPIENKIVSKSLESAQRKVEGHHFDMRKHLLEYDDVLNKHRTVIYKKRREILDSFKIARMHIAEHPQDAAQDLRTIIFEMIETEVHDVVAFHSGRGGEGDRNPDEIIETVNTMFPITGQEHSELREVIQKDGTGLDSAEGRTAVIDYLVGRARARYDELVAHINNTEMMLEIEKGVSLRAIDTLWIDHLVSIDHLRTGIGLRGYGQRDPLVEYKKETYRLFHMLVNAIQKEVVYSIYKVGVAADLAPSLMQRQGITFSGAAKELGSGSNTQNSGAAVFKAPSGMVGVGLGGAEGAQKVGRNDPCPCGSGKKYKKCHGA